MIIYLITVLFAFIYTYYLDYLDYIKSDKIYKSYKSYKVYLNDNENINIIGRIIFSILWPASLVVFLILEFFTIIKRKIKFNIYDLLEKLFKFIYEKINK